MERAFKHIRHGAQRPGLGHRIVESSIQLNRYRHAYIIVTPDVLLVIIVPLFQKVNILVHDHEICRNVSPLI